MFGYILPRRDKLSDEAVRRYKAAYCGLCRSLKKRYGFHARFLVNYDMTFLYFLLKEGERQAIERCFCPARVFCKKDCLVCDRTMELATDLSVLLSYWKLTDAMLDSKAFSKLGAGALRLLFRRAYRKAAERLPQSDALFSGQLSHLQKLEQTKCASLDRTADAFAKMLGGCACYIDDAIQKRIIEQLLYHVGRFLYLADALEDLPKDVKKDRYNPLRYRYALADGALSEQDKKQLLQTIDASIDMAAAALELLTPRADDEIVKNIIYYGMPAVIMSVAEGKFRKRGTKK